MSAILSEFDDFTRERDLIGQMLLAYGEMEFVLLGMIGDALSIDHPTAARILFRVNGEYARIQVADAILRPVLAKFKLKDKWIAAYSATKHCKNLRNQYAHCHWQLWNGKLYFMDLDEEVRNAGDGDGDLEVSLRPIDFLLVDRQFAYFEYTLSCLYFLRDRLGRALDKPTEDLPFPEPKSISQPPRDNRPAKISSPNGQTKTESRE
jgi:hypothetical protein